MPKIIGFVKFVLISFISTCLPISAHLVFQAMYIAMNTFQVVAKHADAFEGVWRERESFLSEFDGFLEFKLLRSKPSEGENSAVTFVSHSTWKNEEGFQEWVNSDHMKKAHSGKSKTTGMVMGPPKFQGFEVVLDQTK